MKPVPPPTGTFFTDQLAGHFLLKPFQALVVLLQVEQDEERDALFGQLLQTPPQGRRQSVSGTHDTSFSIATWLIT